jgi:HEAT repeat protein
MRTPHTRPLPVGLFAVLFVSLLFTPTPAAPADAPDSADEQVLKENKVPVDGPGLLEFFRKRTLDAADEAQIKGLIVQLGDDDFDLREDASQRLTDVGLRAKPFLTRALTDPDAEVIHRARECLRHIDQGGAAVNVAAAAALVLARRRPDGAVEALLNFLPSLADDNLAEEVRNVLADLAVRDGKPEPVLVAALADKSPAKRAAAAVALCRAKVTDELPAVRKLLDDADPVVRSRAALALAALREKAAVPALIGVLDQLPPAEASRVADYLYRLADDKGPPPPAGDDVAARRKYRDAWKAWWDANGEKLDAARLEEADKLLGFTLVVLLERGEIMDLDAANKPRFTLDGLAFPLDAQLLPNDHVLVAEHNGNRVTERNSKNEVVWEKKIDQPLVAQRLANGNTFISTHTQVMEVKPNGDEVSSYNPPNGEMIMKAQKLRNGDVALVLQLGGTRFVRVNAKGEKLTDFAVQVKYSGGRIDVTPSGNVVVPEADANRVAEYDAKGQVVWEAPFEQPVAAVRLPNGNTLVTSFLPDQGAVELDRAGKKVWQYKQPTKVTRAFRR